MVDTVAERFHLEITKRLPAGWEEVFAAWTNPEHMKQWIGPMGSADVPLLEPITGGSFQIDMHANGETYVHKRKFLEVTPPERLQFTWNRTGSAEAESIVTVELAEDGDGTVLTLRHEGLSSEKSVKDHTGGWQAIAGQLAAALSS